MGEHEKTDRRGWIVHGRVQGVGFRWWTQRTGRELSLGGHVRNLPDGTVEVHAAGPANVLDSFELRLHQGPMAARVARVETIAPDDRTATGDFLMEVW